MFVGFFLLNPDFSKLGKDGVKTIFLEFRTARGTCVDRTETNTNRLYFPIGTLNFRFSRLQKKSKMKTEIKDPRKLILGKFKTHINHRQKKY